MVKNNRELKIVLGIDPGLRFTGWSLVKFANSQLEVLSSGSIETNAKEDIAKRLYDINLGILAIVNQCRPSEVAMEETFINKDAQTSMKLSYARGVALMSIGSLGLKVFEYSPNKVKKTVTGSGHADKEQIKKMLKFIVPKYQQNNKDALDATAIAICHLYHHQRF